MPLSLKEAETAAYIDPSQENLAVYVKLLEEAPAWDDLSAAESDRDELASQLDTLTEAAHNVVDNWEAGDLAGAIRGLAALL